MSRSIYQLICDNIKDGVLDENFEIPDEGGSEIKWAPGAMDGVTLYHSAHQGLGPDETKKMARALKAAASDNFPEADALFKEWTERNRAVSVVDELQDYVIKHADRLPPRGMHNTAMNLVLNSEHKECVKIGLEILELFGEPDEAIKEMIRRVGLYEEFTIFSVWNMQKWESGNDEIFKLARKVSSWGRIHAVERLEPETEEIRHWILTEGAMNYVMPAYTALTCWYKSQAEEVLFCRPTTEEFAGIATMIEGLLDEGPVAGISRIDNAFEILSRFVTIAPEYQLTDDEFRVVESAKEWLDAPDVMN